MHGRQARDLTQAPPLFGIRRDLVGAVGADEHDVLVDEVPGEEVEQVPGRRVGPVQVFERDDDRISAPRPTTSSSNGAKSAPAAVPGPPDPPRSIRASGATVGPTVNALGFARRTSRSRSANGASGITSPPIGTHRRDQFRTGAPGSFGDERRLADARFTADEQHRGRAWRAAATARSKAASSSPRPTKSAVDGGSGTGLPSIAPPPSGSEGSCPMWRPRP